MLESLNIPVTAEIASNYAFLYNLSTKVNDPTNILLFAEILIMICCMQYEHNEYVNEFVNIMYS